MCHVQTLANAEGHCHDHHGRILASGRSPDHFHAADNVHISRSTVHAAYENHVGPVLLDIHKRLILICVVPNNVKAPQIKSLCIEVFKFNSLSIFTFAVPLDSLLAVSLSVNDRRFLFVLVI